MIKFKTSTGTVSVDNWGYELQGKNGNPLDVSLLASATHDLLVVDASRDGTNALRFSEGEVTRMKDGMGGRSVVVSYVSIGEASDFRDYWRTGWTSTGDASGKLTGKAPDWLGPVNPDWPEGRKVRYWDEDWQKIIFNDQKTGEIDAIVKAGFDAAYLDIVDGYYFWGEEVSDKDRGTGDPANVRQAAKRMVDFIVALTEHARETNPDFFVIPQNGGWILNDLGNDPARKKAYLDAIGGIAVEDLYYGGNKDENNALNPDEEMIRILKRDFLDKGKPVFVVDYVNGSKRVAEFTKLALEDGFIPFASPDRDLDRLVGTHDGDPAYILPTGIADTLRGSTLADAINGLGGNDVLSGRAGDDTLRGAAGDDRLTGGSGADQLYGGSGADTFVFRSIRDSAATPSGRDIIAGFLRKQGDTISLTGMDADTTKGGDQAFNFIDGDRFSGKAGELRVMRKSGDTFLSGDVDGDGEADFSIRVDGKVAFVEADFIL
ncbi:endo alpha-1,4 polygalactosaminidase [Rhizobium sp. TRM95111]|uniref:MJ1477/TM1410 family putative glycoside hydrolase n=1 Tax=Rhizobium alarense TaxID=2846851 RepID=UPI001F1937AC|nr:MJ1477/TM1410 family putative glycoside hydrolase [Rhizobium alarense]MCF3643009.1 endo alpha-1,4 polygalactosaminidase [Rhizobium alarense]